MGYGAAVESEDGKAVRRGLPATQKEKANQVWTELQDQYFATELRNTTERTIDLDLFFRILRADREWPQLKARLEAE